jgi:3-oxoacyl-[acyl-carrier-protein] synthase II
MTSDAEHLTRPHPEGLGLRLALEAALRRAAIGPTDVGYINPHATSTPQGDVAEYLSMKAVFGDALRKIPISATKSMIGHLLGGAGAAEAIAVVCSLRDQVLHPSINVDRLDPVFEIDLVRERRRADVRHAVSNSAGFGGHNCVLAFERA